MLSTLSMRLPSNAVCIIVSTCTRTHAPRARTRMRMSKGKGAARHMFNMHVQACTRKLSRSPGTSPSMSFASLPGSPCLDSSATDHSVRFCFEPRLRPGLAALRNGEPLPGPGPHSAYRAKPSFPRGHHSEGMAAFVSSNFTPVWSFPPSPINPGFGVVPCSPRRIRPPLSSFRIAVRQAEVTISRMSRHTDPFRAIFSGLHLACP